ncbi:MAG: aminotransferase class I/II-fold pyridoxal phosphate-dependent enzyme [Elusimicrobia bacterium]|nr:aminotransferase class I/II-fold pyridoxal phosphate-dependent enzyme [Elusimicrobiota bacterium]
MKFTMNKRLAKLPPYIFVHLGNLKRQAAAAGHKVIDLGQGSPDLPSPDYVVAEAQKAVADAKLHGYPIANGLPEYRKAIAGWYKRRFGADLDPDAEVLPLIGSKEGLGHLLMAICDPGDSVLVPTPCYPVHFNGPILAGAEPKLMPLKAGNGFLPDLDAIPAADLAAAKAMILNYPNNPTGATLPDHALLKKALALAAKHGFLLIYDNAYSEIVFDGYKAPSILELPGAKEHAVEFHSTSKSYSMAGWRLGFTVGNREAIQTLGKLKGFLDYGVPSFLQKAAIAALEGPDEYVRKASAVYQERRDALVKALAGVGWTAEPPKAAMYLWTALPREAAGLTSLEFCERLIREHGVVVSPGSGFGPAGEGFVRFSLIQPPAVLREAVERIGRYLKTLKAPEKVAR